jgi:hypothetical protein
MSDELKSTEPLNNYRLVDGHIYVRIGSDWDEIYKERDALRNQLEIAVEAIKDASARANGLRDNPNIPPPMYQLINLMADKLNDALAEIEKIGEKK